MSSTAAACVLLAFKAFVLNISALNASQTNAPVINSAQSLLFKVNSFILPTKKFYVHLSQVEDQDKIVKGVPATIGDERQSEAPSRLYFGKPRQVFY